jgi:hypothetical protein
MAATATKPAAKAGRSKNRWPYKFELVPLDLLTVDERYQRPLTKRVEKIVKDFKPHLIGTLAVSVRGDGIRAVIDGQQRLEALRILEEGPAPCCVYHGLTVEQEADIFADLQTERTGMATYLRFRAALVAKKPDALAIAALVNEAGFELSTTETPHTVKAISALEKVYRREPGMLLKVMQIIAAAWPDASTPYRTAGEVIQGLAIFLRREKRVNEARLIDRLSSVEPSNLRHRANALKEGSGSGGGSPGYMADAILGVYMRGGSRVNAAS